MEHQTKINFDSIQHKYTDENGNIYTSVTTLINKYVPEFNKKYWSMYIALRDCGFRVKQVKGNKGIIVNGTYYDLDYLYQHPVNKVEVTRVVTQWKQITQEACDRGNKIHDYLETNINKSKEDDRGVTNEYVKPNITLQGQILILKTKHDLDKTGILDTYPEIYTRLLLYINMGCTLFAEKRVYSTQFQIAGTIDVLIVKGKYFAILDWKTNKDVMMFTSGYFKKERLGNKYIKTSEFVYKPEYMYKPLDNIEKCKGNIYSIQLSTYAYIMLLWGYQLVENGLEIFHIRPNEKPKLIKVKFYKEEVSRMFNHHYHNRVLTNNYNNGLFGIK